MPRKRRIEYPGMICHVATRGNRQLPVYMDPWDRAGFLQALARVAREHEWRVLSHCLMGNHYHLMLELPEGNLADGMHRLNSTFARRFNKRYGHVGSHLFQKRYWSEPITDDSRLWNTFAYIAMNPVRAGLCRAPESWIWSSTGALLGLRPPPPFLHTRRALALIHEDRTVARARLRDLIQRPSLEELLTHPTPANLRIAQTQFDLTVRELASRIGLSPATVSRRLAAA
jgi:putative transposase